MAANNSSVPRYVGMDNLRPTIILRTALLLLLFLAVIPYAGHDTWVEAYTLSALFLIAGIAAFYNTSGHSPGQLVLPLILLGVYSFLQGTSAALEYSGAINSPLLPASMDPAASIWSAVKIVGFAASVTTIGILFRLRVALLFWSLIAIGTLNALFGIVRFAVQQGDPESGRPFLLPVLEPGVGFGTFINQNHFAYLMLMTLGLVVASVMNSAFAGRARAVALGAAALLFTSLVLTGSRAGIIGSILVIAAAIIFPPSINFRESEDGGHLSGIGKRVAMVAIAVVGLIGGITLIGQDRVVDRFERIPMHLKRSTNSPSFTRPDVWLASVSVIRDHPVYGVGFGSFRTAVTQNIDISGNVVPKESHNDYLELAASGGLIAVALGIWFLFGVFDRVKREAFRSRGTTRVMQFGALYSLGGVAFHSLFDFGLQLIGVWLFAAALIAIATHRKIEPTGDEGTSVTRVRLPLRLFGTFTFSILCIASFLFGTIRLQEHLAIAGSPYLILHEYSAIPFDAQSQETAAVLRERGGDQEAALVHMQSAVLFRPNDYELWQRFAALQHKLGRIDAADEAYKRSIQLAPKFGSPAFEYGNFLINIGRASEGAEQLSLARRRDPELLEPIVEQAWERSGRDPAKLLDVLGSLDRNEREDVAGFLLAKQEYDGVLLTACGEGSVSDEFRFELVRDLTELHLYQLAKTLHEPSCKRDTTAILNGGFEDDKINDGTMFSWLTAARTQSFRPELDTAEKFAGMRSLRLRFAGGGAASNKFLSQLVTPEPGEYGFSFGYRTRELTTGSSLVCRLVARDHSDERIMKEIPLPASDGKWTTISSTVQIPDGTDAMEIVIMQLPCADKLCPIFGELWVDEFELSAQ